MWNEGRSAVLLKPHANCVQFSTKEVENHRSVVFTFDKGFIDMH